MRQLVKSESGAQSPNPTKASSTANTADTKNMKLNIHPSGLCLTLSKLPACRSMRNKNITMSSPFVHKWCLLTPSVLSFFSCRRDRYMFRKGRDLLETRAWCILEQLWFLINVLRLGLSLSISGVSQNIIPEPGQQTLLRTISGLYRQAVIQLGATNSTFYWTLHSSPSSMIRSSDWFCADLTVGSSSWTYSVQSNPFVFLWLPLRLTSGAVETFPNMLFEGLGTSSAL